MRRRANAGRVWLLLLLSGATAGALSAQEPAAPQQAPTVRFTPRLDHALERRLAGFLSRPGYRVWTRDTVIARDAEIPDRLLVLGSAARIAGRVEGDVFVVAGDLFLRPGARVAGDVVVLGGGYYASDLAEVEGDVIYRPNELYRVVGEDRAYRIYPVREMPRAIELHGLYGFGFPTYQRVDAVTLSWGATLRALSFPWQPSLSVDGRFLTGPSDFEGSLRQYWYPTADLEVGVEWERVTRTNEEWVRGDVSNTISFFFAGDDFRNYYSADRLAFVLGRTRSAFWWPSITVQRERAHSVEAADRFVLFGSDEVLSNPAIDDGEMWSLIVETGIGTRSGPNRFEAKVRIEAADSAVAGDFRFLLGEGSLRWSFPAAAGHRVEIFGLARGDLSGTLPRQRWTAFGGRATLPTFDRLAFEGPRVLYGQLTYLVPIPALRVGILGAPGVFVRGASGAAWGPDDPVRFHTNVSAGASLSGLEVGLAADPAASDLDLAVYGVLRLPGDL